METLQRTANRGSVSTGYDVDNSLKFESANTESLTKSQTDSNKKTWTLSFWFKRTKVDSDLQYVYHYNVSSGNEFYFLINGTSDYRIEEYNSGAQIRFHSGGSGDSFVDPHAWYHMVIACDTTQSTEANRFKIYKNGVDVTATSGYFSTAQYPSQDYETRINNSAATISVGKSISASTNFCGYMAEVNFIDGLMKQASDFGEFDSASGIWKPIEYTGSYGNEGYFLNFADASDLGDDESGNGKDFTENNITSADQATDTCTNNFCTWSPLWVYATNRTITEGGTKLTGSSAWGGCKGSIGVTNGKWYWENKASGNDTIVGWQTANEAYTISGNAHDLVSTIAFYEGGNYIWIKDSTSGRNDTSCSGTYAGSQVVGFALDLDSSPQTATFYRNGSAIASDVNIDGLANKTIFPFISQYNQNTESNFGGYTSISNTHTNTDENGYGSFVYAPPSGYFAICTKNLAQYG